MWTTALAVASRTGRARAARNTRLAVAGLGMAAALATSDTDLVLHAGFAAAYALVSVLWSVLPPTRVLAPLSVGFDVACLQLTMHLTGGLAGPGPILLVLHVLTAMLVDRRRTGPTVAAGHLLGLAVATWLSQAGLATTPDRGLDPLAQVVVLGGGLLAAAVLTSWLTRVNQADLMARREVLERLGRLATRLAGATTTGEVHEALFDHVTTLHGGRAVLVGLDGSLPEVLAGRGTLGAPAVRLRPMGLVARAGDRRRTVVVGELDDLLDDWLGDVMPGARDLAAVPLVAQGRTVAVLAVEGVALDTGAVAALERAADHAALALASVALQDALTERAMTDGLTGVANRRAFDVALDRELARAAREATDVSLLLLDLDHFKQVNDAHGHTVGDEVLAAVAAAMVGEVRPTDVVARYGGEEFAVVLPEAGPERAAAVAERLRVAVAAVTSPGPGVTVSVGVATADAVSGLDPHAFLRRADEALYRAKRAGRDRVAVA